MKRITSLATRLLSRIKEDNEMVCFPSN